jgi:hypothetical protein
MIIMTDAKDKYILKIYDYRMAPRVPYVLLITHTQLIRTHFGRLVFGSITLQNAYIIFPLFKSSVISSMPPAAREKVKKAFTNTVHINIQNTHINGTSQHRPKTRNISFNSQGLAHAEDT